MRIAVQNPNMREGPLLSYVGGCVRFAEMFADVLYLPQMKEEDPALAEQARNGLTVGGSLEGRPVEVVFDGSALNDRADVLVCFTGMPWEQWHEPPAEFTGMKVFHVSDYVFNPRESHEALRNGGVDYVLGYTAHDRYDLFFSRMYPTYNGRVIPFPFGFGDRFLVDMPFSQRRPKVVGLGAVNPTGLQEATRPAILSEYIAFHEPEMWTHRWRRMLFENAAELADIFESRYPAYPDTNNLEYDAVLELATHAMFANDVGLMNFPPARTYEGLAAGAALVCDGHPSYADLGLVNGVNYIVHKPHDIEDFRRTVESYLAEPAELERVANAGRDLARTHFTHDAVATKLRDDIYALWVGRA